MSYSKAVDVIARKAVANLLAFEDWVADDWESFPDLGENDWAAVTERVRAMAEKMSPPAEDYDAAYQLLARRAADAGGGVYGT